MPKAIRRFSFFVSVALGAAVVPGSALAACVLADAAGNWQVYSINPYFGEWARCKVSIGANGVIGNTNCISDDGSSAQLTAGSVQLLSGAACAFKGTFKLGGVAHTIRHATLAKDKFTAEGVGTFDSGSTFLFSMTKL